MSKWEVHISQTELYIVPDVEASTEEEAKEKGLALWEENKAEYHHDSDGDESAYEVEEKSDE